ncbi:LuxR family transcriptional regulator [Actinokineospora pegani]|uniref:LuxR family transcriptional regulator n=1 Tax=Actinokineospora pegani TaxID=2654637 RepID=UPI0012EAA2B4|nr:response regulator transcription factor [Actinokineospora pegani]
MPARPVRLWLIDDHELVAEALAAALARVEDLWVLGRSATDEDDLLARLGRDRPDVVVLDPAGADAADLIPAVRAAVPGAAVVVLTGADDEERAVAAARLGADGWVGKAEPLAEVVDVLRGVGRGEGRFPARHLGAVLRGLREDVRRHRDGGGPLAALSPRERQVLAAMVDGLRGHQIAGELGLSSNTVRTHTHSIYAKLGVHSRLAAVGVARAAGLLPRRQVLPTMS